MCAECDLSFAHKVYLCVTCRIVWKCHPYRPGIQTVHCTRCGMTGINMGFRWRAPKLTNEKAWKLIEKGDYLWDKRAIAKSRRAQAEQALKDHWEWVKQHSKPGSKIPNNFRRKFLK